MSDLILKDVSFSYPGGFLAVDHINMEIKSGENVAIVGQNGAGKTTTVKTVSYTHLVRAKAFFPTLVPLILGAVIGSEERVLTLEARGFSMQCEKTPVSYTHLDRITKQRL